MIIMQLCSTPWKPALLHRVRCSSAKQAEVLTCSTQDDQQSYQGHLVAQHGVEIAVG